MGHVQQAARFQDIECAADIRVESTGGAGFTRGAQDGSGVVDAVHSISPHRVEYVHQLADVARDELDPFGEVRPPGGSAARRAKSTTSSPSASSCRAK